MKLNPENDGIDHINIYSKGKTKIGRFLSNFSYVPIEIDNKIFNSLEHYYHYLVMPIEQREGYYYIIKNMSAADVKAYSKNLKRIRIELDKDLFKEAFKLKLNKCEILDDILNNKLPLTHYYLNHSNKIIDVPQHQWMIDMINSVLGDLNDS